jgi:hypothetical protein
MADSVTTANAPWYYQAVYTAADPGPSYFRLNNATAASATALYLDPVDYNQVDRSTILAAVKSGDLVRVGELPDTTQWVEYRLTGDPVRTSAGTQCRSPTSNQHGRADVRERAQDAAPVRTVRHDTGTGVGTAAYVDVAELQRVLQKPSPTADEQAAMQRDLDTAAGIDWDLDYDPVDNPAPPPTPSNTASSPTSTSTGPSSCGRPPTPVRCPAGRRRHDPACRPATPGIATTCA